ncbi:MAG: type IV pilus secretin PilQ [Gammaproteobacteria bacterium]
MTFKINLLADYWRQQRKQHWRKILYSCLILLLLLSAVGFYLHQQTIMQMQLQQEISVLQGQLSELAVPPPVNLPLETTPAVPIATGVISLQQAQMDIREVLQQISASGNMNLLLHESVQGTVTVNFQQLPWREALNVVLELADLVLEQRDNIMLISSAQDESKRLEVVLHQQQQSEELLPLESQLLSVRYAKAAELAKLLQAPDQEWMSKRGTVSVDERTNTLVVRDLPANLQQIQEMISQLDIPVRQVAIEARIMNVQESFSKELGVLWEITGSAGIDNAQLATLSNDILINLELLALENEHLVEELAHPRLITADQQTAIIRQGEEIPYQQSAEYGASTISFKPAVLELQVTPHITPDDHIILKLLVKNDTRGAQALADNVPIITTKEIRTQVLVRNGQTVALGGIYTIGKSQQEDRVPVLGRIPGLGKLFTYKSELDERKQLLVLVTPKIIVE